jgi:uncharacterized protein YutE (UPF0331/DUF86 family)
MYYVNRESIRSRLDCLTEVSEALSAASASWNGTLTEGLAQERALHLAAEIVTDVGNALIDGFLMRDPSSYEDIVDIIATESVITGEVAEPLRRLVALRKKLVQEYDSWPRRELHPLTPVMPAVLNAFASQVSDYLHQELDA